MVTRFVCWKLAVAIVIIISCLGYCWAQQQDAVARQRALEDKEFQTAANKWMKAPIDVRTQIDPVSSQDRPSRDAYWDNLIGASAPLSDPSTHAHPIAIGDADPWAPELGDLGAGVLAIGKFETSRTILSASRRSVYTEIQFRIQRVFGHPDAPVREGQLVDLDRPGGTIIAPWGETLSYEIHPEQMGLQPQHAYLIRLGYHTAGNFYSGGYKTGELWDLTDGTVKPGNHLQKHRAEHGMSEINGLSVDALIQLLDKKYQDYYQGRR
jgi:hypothetical protein